MDLGSEEGLAGLEAAAKRLRGHPDVNAKAGYIAVPDVLLEVMVNQPAGKGEVAADRLADALSVERPGQGVDHAVGNGAVILVALVIGRNEIEPSFQDWANQQVNPFGGNAAQVGVHHRAGPGSEPLRQQENHPKGAALTRDAMIGRGEPVHRVHGVRNL